MHYQVKTEKSFNEISYIKNWIYFKCRKNINLEKFVYKNLFSKLHNAILKPSLFRSQEIITSKCGLWHPFCLLRSGGVTYAADMYLCLCTVVKSRDSKLHNLLLPLQFTGWPSAYTCPLWRSREATVPSWESGLSDSWDLCWKILTNILIWEKHV